MRNITAKAAEQVPGTGIWRHLRTADYRMPPAGRPGCSHLPCTP